MKTHTAVVKNRELTITSPRVVQNQLNADMLDLSLDSEWDGMAVSVIFGCGDSAVKLVWEGQPIAIPSQLTAEPGYIPVTVAGYQGDVRVVSAEAKDALVVVASGCYDGSDPVPESQDMLGQLTQAAKDANDAADRANDAADRCEKVIKESIGGEGQTNDYELLSNRPTIAGVTVEGDAESLEKYGLKTISEDVIDSICV